MTDPRSPFECFHVSNTLTYASLLGGTAAIAAASRGSAAAPAALIAAAAIADTFDGRLARRFSRTDAMRAFGAELDSLCDAAVFGAAPVICAGWLNPAPAGSHALLWWTCAFVYLACAVTRLGFYNVTEDSGGFVGMPAPVAALVWATLQPASPGPGLEAATFALLGVAMVAPLRVPRPSGVGLAAFVMWPVGLLGVYAAKLLG